MSKKGDEDMKKTLEDYREFIFQEFCQEKFLQWFMQGIAMVKARPGGLAPEEIREEICEAQFREHFEKGERELCHRFWQFLPAKAEQMLAKYGAEGNAGEDSQKEGTREDQ